MNFRPFDGRPVFPRQIEIHLPNSTMLHCNFKCVHCEGRLVEKDRWSYDKLLFGLIRNLDGRIPNFIISGAYTEPTLNRNLINYIELIKSTGANYGLHTNGLLFACRESKQKFLSRLFSVSDPGDYISVSLDAGSHASFEKTKQVPGILFDKVLEGVGIAGALKDQNKDESPKLRLTYLLNPDNVATAEIESSVKIARAMGADSLRFSIPYAPYGTPMPGSIHYQSSFEVPVFAHASKNLAPYLSVSGEDRPFVFFLPPETQDVNRMYFSRCFHGYNMITLGADGMLYRCSSTASPTFAGHRLGIMTRKMHRFMKILLKNQDPDFNPAKRCMPAGARCTRAALDINATFGLIHDSQDLWRLISHGLLS